jgi:hypothetical protein
VTTITATTKVGHKAALNVLHGIRYAREQGTPINTHVTINFTTLGFDEREAGTLFKSLRGRISRWWRYQRACGRASGELACVYCHANPAGSRHVHWLIHVPAELAPAFRLRVEKLLKKICAVQHLGDGLAIGPVATPGSLAKYVLRGIDPAYASHLHIEPANEGLVTGRRTGAAKGISKAARKRAGWKRKRS